MGEYVLKSKKISHNDSYEVIVVGGGPAGCSAAIASARNGAKTLLIEATGALGGMGTMGLVPAWCPFSNKEEIIYKGIAEEIFMESKNSLAHIPEEKVDWVEINAEKLKRIYDDKVTGSGANVLFNTFLTDVDAENGVVKTIIVSSKLGLTAYSAKIFIDCTGDGDLCAWAGAEYEVGDDGMVQASTLCFNVSNINEYAYRTHEKLHNANPNSPIYKMLESGKYPHLSDPHFCNSLVGPDTVGFNAGHLWDVDNTNPKTVTDALIEGRKMSADILSGLKEFCPSIFAGAEISQTAPLMGIRESRRILGDYVLNVDDYMARRGFDDEIGRCCYYIDCHKSKEEKAKNNIGSNRYNPGESYGIPYRCLTPKGLKNVLVAGRCISTDRPVQASTRVMPVCLVTGQAAGTATKLALDAGDVHTVDSQSLRKMLVDIGAYIK